MPLPSILFWFLLFVYLLCTTNLSEDTDDMIIIYTGFMFVCDVCSSRACSNPSHSINSPVLDLSSLRLFIQSRRLRRHPFLKPALRPPQSKFVTLRARWVFRTPFPLAKRTYMPQKLASGSQSLLGRAPRGHFKSSTSPGMVRWCPNYMF